MSPSRPATSNSRRQRQRHGSQERGSASVELVIVLPALFAVMFLGVQAALDYHARTVAIAAAQEGARAAGAQDGHQIAGIRAATSFVATAGGASVLEHTVATASRTVTTATVTVRGTSLSVIPGWHPTIRQSATVPVERITAP
jgi:Flp pilus assembly protein TadG